MVERINNDSLFKLVNSNMHSWNGESIGWCRLGNKSSGKKKGAEAIKVWMPMSTRFRVDSYDWH